METRPPPAAPPAAGKAGSAPLPGRPEWWIAHGIVLAIAALYLGSLDAPFIFDDHESITANPTIRQLWPPGEVLSPPGRGTTVQGRPVLNLSFALNHAFGGLSEANFRLTNIVLHACAALLLFGIVRRTLQRPPLRDAYGAAALPLAGAAALLWAVHPLQTESVTYIVQRAESLMGIFYLLTLYAFIRSLDAPQPRRWQAVAVASCLLGMGTKEVMASAPVMVLLYDRFFVAGNWPEVWRRRKAFYGALASTWLLLAALVIGAGGRGGTAASSVLLSATGYWAVQPYAIATYLKLTFWPAPLILDYGTWTVRGAGDVILPGLLVAALVGATLYGWRRWHPAAYAGLWFFAILAPASLAPMARQTVVEHRMYLALAPVAVLLVLGLHRALRRAAVPVAVAAAVALSLATLDRNRDYLSTLAIWEDTVAKNPANHWARNNLGLVLHQAGRHAEALAQYDAALRSMPLDPGSHFNAGNTLMALERADEAAARYAEAVRLDPDYVDARYNLGLALHKAGRFADAARELAQVARTEPDRAEFQASLGLALVRSGQRAEAVNAFERALRLRPVYPEAAYNLGLIHLQTGRWTDAVAQFEATLKAEPERARAHASLAVALAQLDRIDDAIAALREAVRLDPANAESHNNLGALYLHRGRKAEAEAAFTEAVRLDPASASARKMLEDLRAGKL